MHPSRPNQGGRPGKGGRGPKLPPSPDLRTVHDDDDVIVVEKPAGLPVEHPRGASAVASVRRRARGGRGPNPVHRVDADASGVLVFAKTYDATQSLREEFKTRRVHRQYLAVVEGELDVGYAATVQSEVDLPMNAPPRVLSPRQGRSLSPNTTRRTAVTHYRVVEVGEGASLIHCRAETDYPGQVRVHLASIGHPILGDREHGSQDQRLRRLGLHLTEVSFTHPSDGESARVRVDPPREFRDLVRGRLQSESQTGWEEVADWYGSLVGSGRSDHHEKTVIPGTLELLGSKLGARVLDIACGEGLLCRELVAAGADVVGVDASPQLVEMAKASEPAAEFRVVDARALGEASLGDFDAATCVLAIMNIDDIGAVFTQCHDCLRPGGQFVLVMLHPAFRAPRTTSWDWDERSEITQFRRVDAYLSPSDVPIVMNPGAAARGEAQVTTTTYHRPLSGYVNALSDAGFVVDRIEEWASARRSEPGPRADAENRARREIPMFMAIRARRPAAT